MSLRSTLLPLALVAGLPLMAQSASFGLAAGFSKPGGDMTHNVDSDLQIGWGLQLRVKLGAGNAIVPRLDRVTFSGDADHYYTVWVPGAGNVSWTGTRHTESTLTSFGVDYNWFPSRKAGEGFYFGGGLGFLQKNDTYSNPYGISEGADSSKSRLYGALMLGGVVANGHLDISARLQFFGDERQADTYNSSSGQYQANYSMSSVFTLGLAYHF